MTFEFKFPDIGEGITEGEISKWYIKEGDSVKEGDILAEVETDETMVEIPSPRKGAILKLHYDVGDTAEVGKALVTFGDDAKENDVLTADVKDVKPRILKKSDLYGGIERIKYKGTRKIVADNVINSQAKTVPVTHHDEADITDLWEHRNKEKIFAVEKGIRLTLLPFIVKALISALKKHPILNSTLNEDDAEIIVKKYYNIGISVDTEAGLMIPVVKIADKKSVLDLAVEINSLADKAKSRKLDASDINGGTFTVINYGSIGGYCATPIINYPECAVLGLGKIVDRPRIIGNEIKARKILPISVTFDHRITDSAECARFTNDLIAHLEDTDKMIFEG